MFCRGFPWDFEGGFMLVSDYRVLVAEDVPARLELLKLAERLECGRFA